MNMDYRRNDKMALDISNGGMTNFPEYFEGLTNLRELNSRNNELVDLSFVPKELVSLNVSKNIIESIESIPSSLEEIDLSENYLRMIPELPQGLKVLKCSKNYLRSVPMNTENLEYFDCSVNEIPSITRDFSKLLHFDCSYNNITKLLIEAPLLRYINLSYNVIKCMDFSRYENLREFIAVHCELERIKLPPNALIVNVSHNHLKKIKLNEGIEEFYAKNNLFIKQPDLPISVRIVYLGDNPIVDKEDLDQDMEQCNPQCNNQEY